MACVALVTLVQRRANYDSVLFMAWEAILCAGVILAAGCCHRLRTSLGQLPLRQGLEQRLNVATVILLLVAFASPWAINFLAKRCGVGNGSEIVMLGTLGWAGLSSALLGTRSRTVSLSVVCSGFVALFATLISDVASATWFAYAWVALCMWWLVGNHWEGLESRSAEHIDRSVGLRWTYLALVLVVFVGSTLAIGHRVPVWQRLRAELMPTSGGTTGKDSAARSGVGNGDALIAAKNHATSFGAVETDMFLDSEKPSLFDVFSDEFGEPKPKESVEQAQALSPQDVQSDEGKFSEANRSSSASEFGIERKPTERKALPEDLVSNALFFWQGGAHAHLAVERFHHFDGVTWTGAPITRAEASRAAKPGAIEVEQQSWFFAPGNKFASSLSPFRGAVAEAAKFTRYGSPIIPSRCGTKLWSIDQISRADFFHYDASDCLSMPGRERVPDYTMVRFVNGEIDLEKMEQLLQHCSPGKEHVGGAKTCQEELAELAHSYADETSRGWEQVRSVVEGLRREFRHRQGNVDTKHQTALEQFLQVRSGPSYLFATVAALMLEHLGYETRLVTGFYINPKHYVKADNEYAVQGSDVHVWLEINAGHGYWIPLEPTPGYRAPRTTASIWYQAMQARWEIAGCCLVASISLSILYLLRAWIFDLLCWCCAPALVVLSDRRRVRWTAWILDVRLSLLGRKRPRGAVLRKHLSASLNLPECQSNKVRTVLEASDCLLFGNRSSLSAEQRTSILELWRELTVAKLRKLRIVESPS
ncbi:Transglutaminase-like superfamily protein [Aureliella helgolandensis]|uniref:Transglutaminase-like superfamily protein n=2 Tax=Aureliella helgolandensis TaxID=2527968 RepID=A0A518G3Q5_9BACT|nr:Transglutaminase-like superfamily protein [Aureliella helgolandensis]